MPPVRRNYRQYENDLFDRPLVDNARPTNVYKCVIIVVHFVGSKPFWRIERERADDNYTTIFSRRHVPWAGVIIVLLIKSTRFGFESNPDTWKITLSGGTDGNFFRFLSTYFLDA